MHVHGLIGATLIVSLVGGYLLGSIPFGLIATRLGGAGDIRTVGSGNIGATNVLRTGRRDLALITLFGDGAKGAVAVLLATWVISPTAGAVAGAGAFLGHLFPLLLGFRGARVSQRPLEFFSQLRGRSPWQVRWSGCWSPL